MLNAIKMSASLVIASIVLVPIAFGNYEVQESEYESVLNPTYNLHYTTGVISEPYTATTKKSVGTISIKMCAHTSLRTYTIWSTSLGANVSIATLWYVAPPPRSGKERPDIYQDLW